MKKTNPKLVILLIAMVSATLAIKVMPSTLSSWSLLSLDRDALRQEVDRYENLIEEEQKLMVRAEEARQSLTGIEESIFYIPRNLFASEIQTIIRNVSQQTGVEIREMRVAKIEKFEDWLKISQEMSFTIDQRRILPFLDVLKEYRPRLYISRFTVSRSRQQFIGSLTVEAFSRQERDFE